MQVILKGNGRHRVVKSFGTVRIEAEVLRIEQHACQFNQGQTGMFFFDKE